MSVTLDIKLPNGDQAPVWASSWETLSVAMQIVDNEQGVQSAWAMMQKPHVTKINYKWEVKFDDQPNATVELPAGSTINIYR